MWIIYYGLVILAKVLKILLTAFYWLFLLRALASLISRDPFNPVLKFLAAVTEPLIKPIRKILPADFRIGMDISAVIAFFLIVFLKSFLVGLLLDLARKFR